MALTHETTNIQDRTIIKLRVLGLFKSWLFKGNIEFNDDFTAKLNAAAEEIDHKILKVTISKFLNQENMRNTNNYIIFRETPVTVTHSNVTHFLDISPGMFCDQLCLIFSEYCRKIVPKEFLNLNWILHPENSSNINNILQTTKNLSNWIQFELKKVESDKNIFLKTFTYIKDIAFNLFKSNNFLCLKYFIDEIIKYTQFLNEKEILEFNRLHSICSLRTREYLQCVSDLNPPIVPLIHYPLQELQMIFDLGPSFKNNNNNLIDFRKCTLNSYVLDYFFQFCNCPYKVPSCKIVEEWVIANVLNFSST